MSRLAEQIKHYMDINIGYTRKQYYKMISAQFGISQSDAKEYVVFVLDNKIGVGNDVRISK